MSGSRHRKTRFRVPTIVLTAVAIVGIGTGTAQAGGWTWPVDCPQSSGYGIRWGVLHNGTDYGCPIGTPFRAVTDGVITATGPADGYGQWVQMRADTGQLIDYGHIESWNVDVGQRVSTGDILGTTGNRGQTTGPHIHLRIVDPVLGNIDPGAWLAGAAHQDTGSAPLDATHTVVSGDQLSSIAAAYGTTWEAVYEANRDTIVNPNLVYPGQVLRIR